MPQARLAGSGTYTFFTMKIYAAELWVGPQGYAPAAPFALDLRYARKLDGRKIAEASVEQMEKIGAGSPAQRKAWLQKMLAIFPDVHEGSHITGIFVPDEGARFYLDGKPLASINDAGVRARLLRHLARSGHHRAGAARGAAETGRAAAMKPLGLPNLLCYGFFGLPLAMVALPIYVYLPQFYAERAGLPLALIGAALLAARIAAAFIDPLLGWWIERGRGAYARYVALALPLLLAGFLGLFHPPPMQGSGATLAWFGATLMLVYLGFSLATIAHQSWGAALTHAPSERARVTGVREACGLAGVVLAAAVTAVAGYDGLSLAFAAALAIGSALLLARAVRPLAAGPRRAPLLHWRALAAPFAQPRFRALFAVLLVNGVASAIPATLFLFFAADRLRLAAMSGLFLILYFCAAALSMPLWIALARRFGEARSWAGAMLASALVFVWAFGLGAGGGAAVRRDLHLVGPGAGRRPGAAAGAAGRRHRQGRPRRQPRGRLFRRLELGRANDAGAGRRHRAAAARLVWLRAGPAGRHRRAGRRLRAAAVRDEAGGGRDAVARAAT